jgi:hypothetical protein
MEADYTRKTQDIANFRKEYGASTRCSRRIAT